MSSVAVVIPLFNHEAFIAAALESVRNQTRPVQRIVVVDDGSTDRSVETVRAMKDDRIALFQQPNEGAHVALNRGIREAGECDFIAILNSDDVFEPRRIEVGVGFLEANPGIDVICTKMQFIDTGGKPLPQNDPKVRRLDRVWPRGGQNADLPTAMGIANVAKTSSNFLGRAARFRAHPFRAYRYVHDYYFALACVLERRLGVIDESLLRYRTHTTNTIKSGALESVTSETLRMNLDLLAEYAPRLAASAEMRRDLLRYFRSLAGNHADFRAEVFFSLCAQVLARTSEAQIDEIFGETGAGQFPELLQPASREHRENLATVELANLQQAILASRWLAFGRLFGGKYAGPSEGTAEARLGALQERLRRSPWSWIASRMGCFPRGLI